MNGWGYALGTLSGIVFSLGVLILDGLPDYYGFPLIVLASLLMSIVGTLVTQPVRQEILISFYRSIRPFGLWRPVREDAGISNLGLPKKSDNAPRTFINVGLGMVAIVGAYLFPMYLVGHWYTQSILWLCAGVIAAIVLKFTWYDHLPRTYE
jgi:hypothetical protein